MIEAISIVVFVVYVVNMSAESNPQVFAILGTLALAFIRVLPIGQQAFASWSILSR